MPILRTILLGILTIGLVQPGGAASAGDAQKPPTEPGIAALIEDTLSNDVIDPYPLTALRHAEILDFELVRSHRLSTHQWAAIIELEADYGPAPTGVIGFQSVRRGKYRLVISDLDGDLRLHRFSPMPVISTIPTSH